MKITDPDVIKNGEKDLIDAVKEDLDLEMIRRILEKKLSNTTLAAKGGEIVVHDNAIAFRLDFDLNLSGSLMFDRQGNYIPEEGVPIHQEDQDFPDKNTEQEEMPPISRESYTDPDDDFEDDLKIELPEYDFEDTDDIPISETEQTQIKEVETAPDTSNESQQKEENDGLIDDDINDILKESQEFWEQKKDT